MTKKPSKAPKTYPTGGKKKSGGYGKGMGKGKKVMPGSK